MPLSFALIIAVRAKPICRMHILYIFSGYGTNIITQHSFHGAYMIASGIRIKFIFWEISITAIIIIITSTLIVSLLHSIQKRRDAPSPLNTSIRFSRHLSSPLGNPSRTQRGAEKQNCHCLLSFYELCINLWLLLLRFLYYWQDK